MTDILVLNAGSSSIKFAVYDAALTERLSGAAVEIGASARLKIAQQQRALPLPTHEAALQAILDGLAEQGIAPAGLAAAGHRVVHGGQHYDASVLISDRVVADIHALSALAPLHNPHSLAAIQALSRLAPDLPQCASFDTAFHTSNPEVAQRYALPDHLAMGGIRRYGFHGISYASLVDAFGPDLPARLLALHLGNGASLCAIHKGRSLATSMGYSPLDGLTMGTRCGALDPSIALRLARDLGTDAAEALLNRDSGLKGLAGTHDMAALLARDDDQARFAVDHFCYWAARHAGSALVAMGGLDAIAFTGGIGENAPQIRDRIAAHLACFGPVPVHVVPAREERQIARDALALLKAPVS